MQSNIISSESQPSASIENTASPEIQENANPDSDSAPIIVAQAVEGDNAEDIPAKKEDVPAAEPIPVLDDQDNADSRVSAPIETSGANRPASEVQEAPLESETPGNHRTFFLETNIVNNAPLSAQLQRNGRSIIEESLETDATASQTGAFSRDTSSLSRAALGDELRGLASKAAFFLSPRETLSLFGPVLQKTSSFDAAARSDNPVTIDSPSFSSNINATPSVSSPASPPPSSPVIDFIGDGVTLSAVDGSVTAGNNYAVTISAVLIDTDGSETLSQIQISGLHGGYSLNHGANQGNGVWLLDTSDLSGLQIITPAFAGQTHDLTVSVRSVETPVAGDVNLANNTSAWSTDTLTLSHANGIQGLRVTGANEYTLDTSISDSNFQYVLNTVPTGATVKLAAGTFSFDSFMTMDRGDITILGAGRDQSILEFTLDVNVSNKSKAAFTITGDEDSLGLQVTQDAAKGSTTLVLNNVGSLSVGQYIQVYEQNMEGMPGTVTISGLPGGASLSKGTNLGGGNWSVTLADLNSISMTNLSGTPGTANLTANWGGNIENFSVTLTNGATTVKFADELARKLETLAEGYSADFINDLYGGIANMPTYSTDRTAFFGQIDYLVNNKPLRETYAKITAIDTVTKTITLDRGLTFDYDTYGVNTGARVDRVQMLENVVLKDFSIKTVLSDGALLDPYNFGVGVSKTNLYPNYDGFSTLRFVATVGLETDNLALRNNISSGFDIRESIDADVDRLLIDGAYNKGGGGSGYGLNIYGTSDSTFSNIESYNVRHGVLFSTWHSETGNVVHVLGTNRDINFHGGPDANNTVTVDSSILDYADMNNPTYAAFAAANPVLAAGHVYQDWNAVAPGSDEHPPETIEANTIVFKSLVASNDREIVYAFSGGATINTGGGTDTVFSGAGNDTITGGAASDSFVFKGAVVGTDTITDFSLVDKDRLVFINSGALTATENNGDIVFTAAGMTGSVRAQGLTSGGLDLARFNSINYAALGYTVDDMIVMNDVVMTPITLSGPTVINFDGSIFGDSSDGFDVLRLIGSNLNLSVAEITDNGEVENTHLFKGLDAIDTSAVLGTMTLTLTASQTGFTDSNNPLVLFMNGNTITLRIGSTTYANATDVQNDIVIAGSGTINIDANSSQYFKLSDSFNGTVTIDAGGTLVGSANNDHMTGSTSTDTLRGDGGADTIYGLAGGDTIYGDDGNDTIYGGDNNDTIYGGNGNDSLYGDAGNDILYGDDGDDIFYIGPGSDDAYGGAGADRYVFVGTDTTTREDIYTWDAGDVIDLQALFDASGLGGVADINAAIAGGYVSSNTTGAGGVDTRVFFDADGTAGGGVAVEIMRLFNGTAEFNLAADVLV